MVNRKGLGQANTFRTNNNTSTGYGIVYADEVSGHRTVANLTALYALNDWQLSASGDNTDNDAIGQLWYVVNADGNGNGCYYQLKDWNKRKEAAGWSEFKSTGASTAEQEIIYDVSARNGGAVFESLQSLLSSSNLSTLIPTSVRCGGMSIRFVQSSDNKYIQARCMAQNFTADVTQWQCVDDEPMIGSDNLVKSGGIFNNTYFKEVINSYYTEESYWRYDEQNRIIRVASNGFKATKLMDVKVGDIFYVNTSILPPYMTAINICANENNEYSVFTNISSGIVIITEEMYNSGVRKVAFSFNLSSTPNPLVLKCTPTNQIVSELDKNAVKTIPQSLSEQEKNQVKQNIGAVSDNVPTKDSTNLIESGTVYPIKKKLDTVVGEKVETIGTTIEKTSYNVTSQLGYIMPGNISVTHSDAYRTYKITIPYSGYMYIDPNNYGNVGNIFRIGIERTSHTVWEIYYADVNSMPKVNTKLQLIEGDILYVTIEGGLSKSFILQYEYPNTRYYFQNIKFSESQKEEIALLSQKIKIHYVSATKFEVTVPQIGNNAKIVHNFVKQHYENDVPFGSSTVHLVTADVWYPHQILVGGQNAIQGNLNFIYRLTTENAHVGAGHGCEVSIFTKFLADSVEFDPTQSFEDIYCDVFRIILKSNMYATSSPSTGVNAIPVLDENGEPVVTAVHTLNAAYRPNNIIDWDNNLLFKRDNIKFLQLHGGMVQGQASMFDTFTICDGEYTTNEFVWNGTSFERSSIGNSDVLNGNDSKKASSIIMYGKDIIVKQYMERLGMPQSEADANSGQKANYCTCVYYSEVNDPRVKIYMQPTRTDMVNGYLAKEEFNSGDWLKLHLIRQIEVTNG